MRGLSPIAAGQSRSKLKNLEYQPKGDHSHINNGTHHRLPHFWPFILSPYISQKPTFYQKLSPKVLFLFTLSKILEIFLSKTSKRLEFEKKVPKCPLFLWRLSLKDPLFLALHARVWGECCSLKHSQKLENFVFLKQNCAIWRILLGAHLIKVMKQNFSSTGSTDPFVHYGRTSLEGRDDNRPSSPWSHTEGDISYNHPLYDSAHLGSLYKW